MFSFFVLSNDNNKDYIKNMNVIQPDFVIQIFSTYHVEQPI